MAKLTDEEKNQARQSLSGAIGTAARSAVDTIGQASSFTRDRNKPVDIYAEGSPTERVQRNMISPVAATVGTATDAATLIPRAFGKVADNMYRGFTGQPEGDEFIMNPATRALNSRTESVSQPTRSFSAVDNSKFTEPQTALTTRAESSFKPPQYNLVGKPTRAPLTGDAGTDVTETRSFLNADDEWRKSQGTPTSGEFNKTLMRDFDRARQENAAPTREVINGDATRKFRTGANGSEVTSGRTESSTYMPFPTSPVWHGRSPDDLKARVDAYNAEVNAWRTLNGLVPLDQAQASHAGAQAADIPLQAGRADKATALADRKLTLAEQRQNEKDVVDAQRFKTQDQRAADTNRLAQAKLTGDDGAEAGLASTYDPATPPPAGDASQVERGAFNAWTRRNAANIGVDMEKGEKPQRIYEKYFSGSDQGNQAAVLKMLPQEQRGVLSKILADNWERNRK